jgi:gamma-glutamyltranspeptidase/glutathione hydrolase
MARTRHGHGGGAIAAGHPVTARVGADVLARGGNACDALVAAVIASWVSEPTVSGACGGGFLVHRGARSGRTTALDFFVSVPGIGLPGAAREMDRFDVEFGTATQTFHIGIGSSAVPGTCAGIGEAHRRFGSLPWAELVEPAIRLARQGVVITPAHDRLHAILEVVATATPEACGVFAPQGRLLRQGERFAQPQLARTLERLAEAGARDLYRGALARELAAFSAEQGGAITPDDLRSYRVLQRRPLVARYRDAELTLTPPPSSGGVLLAYSLALADRLPPAPSPLSAAWMHVAGAVLVEAERRRGRALVRSLVRGGARRLLEPDSLALGAARVDAALAGGGARPLALPVARGTSHVSVVDAAGDAIAMTSSTGCGSGVFVGDTGLHLNNMLGEEDLTGHAVPRPGERMTSMMAPGMIEAPGLRAVLGSSGSARIRSALYRVVTALVDRGASAREAVDLPRLHPGGGGLDCEFGFPEDALDALDALVDQPVVRWPDRNLYFGGCQVALVRDGRLDAAGDPRRGGDAVIVA